jgi:Ca2+/Na+ antiporter
MAAFPVRYRARQGDTGMEFIKDIINHLSDPKILIVAAGALLFVSLRFPDKFYTNKTGPLVFLGMIIFLVLSMFDKNFRLIVTKPDNVPIVGMLFLVPFFTWFSLREAVRNDKKTAEGKPLIEQEETAEKVLTWPDLVYTELICMVVLTVILIGWSIALAAPIEEPANPGASPNPSKAPWYFLGLQEMLVYFDPWLAGVVFPGLIIVGLGAIPYIDTNPRGNGYYTLKERKWEISTFLFGFLILWILLVILGTFLRGPNWNFFGPYQYWDPHKLEALVNVNLSEFIWVKGLGMGLPSNPIIREIFGFILVLAYFLLLPPLFAKKWFKGFYERLGPARFNVMMFLLLFMTALPIKMALRWLFNLKYIVGIPEYFFNI